MSFPIISSSIDRSSLFQFGFQKERHLLSEMNCFLFFVGESGYSFAFYEIFAVGQFDIDQTYWAMANGTCKMIEILIKEEEKREEKRRENMINIRLNNRLVSIFVSSLGKYCPPHFRDRLDNMSSYRYKTILTHNSSLFVYLRSQFCHWLAIRHIKHRPMTSSIEDGPIVRWIEVLRFESVGEFLLLLGVG